MLFSVRRLNRTGTCLLVACTLANSASAIDHNVPDDFLTIQDAIAAAQAGDAVVITRAGTYTGNFTLKPDIELRGLETARTILRSGGNGPILLLANVQGVVIRNLTFNGGDTGIEIDNCTNVDVHNNVFAMGTAGTGVRVDADSLSDIDIRHNTFHGNGVGIDRASDVPLITNNIFSSNVTAIASSVGITDNNITDFNCTPADDPLYADAEELDFHLRDASPCKDSGNPADSEDSFSADGTDNPDAGAYGGPRADTIPFPVDQPAATATDSATPGRIDVALSWEQNLSYLTTGYQIHYDSDQPGEPYEGSDATDMNGSPEPSPISVGVDSSHTLFNLLSNPVTPAAPELQAAASSNRSLDLSWSAVSGATGYRVEYGIVSAAENQRDVGNVTSYEIDGLENGTTYRVRVSALSQTTYHFALKVVGTTGAGSAESAFSPERSVTLAPVQASAPSNELTGIPEPVTPFPVLPDQGDVSCFIATAAYGHFSHPQVQLLRDFRDRYLLANTPGRAFVSWYYRHSPEAAQFIAQHEILRMLVRWGLLPLIGMAFLMLHAPALAFASAVLLCVLTGTALARAARPSIQSHHRT